MGRLETTGAPDDAIKPAAVRLSKSKKKQIGEQLWNAISQAIGDRGELDTNLEAWNAFYEMETTDKDWPWPDSSNVFIPFIPTQLDTLVARLAGLVYVPRLYLVEGNTPQAQSYQHDVEQFYNAGLNRYDRRQAHYNMLHLGLRDGFSAMDVTWRKTIAHRKVRVAKPAMLGPAMPKIDMVTGEPEIEWVEHEIEQVVYDDYVLDPVECRDLIVVPQTARSLTEAKVVAKRVLLDETTLRSMTMGTDPELFKDAVEEALKYVTAGQSELVTEQQSTHTYSAAGLLNPSGQTGTSGTTEVKVYDRTLSVFRCSTSIFDIDGDGWPEEAVAWVHESSGILLGIDAYRYLHGKRSLVAFTPLPRANRWLGFSLVGRLAPIQIEINASHNARNDQIELRLSPPRYIKDGVKLDDKDAKWGPDVEYTVQDKDDIGLVYTPPMPEDSMQQEMLLQQYGQMFTGLSAPMVGGQSQGRRSAKEVGVQQQSAGIRIDFIAAQVREVERQILDMIHALTLQYGPHEMSEQTQNSDGRPVKLTVPKEKLNQDYNLSVAGLGAPLDQQSRTQERMFIFSLLKDVPFVAGDEIHLYRLVRFLLESTGVPDLTSIIGTEQDAMQRNQQKQQAAQQAQQMQAQQMKVQLLLAQHGIQMQQPHQQQQQGRSQHKPSKGPAVHA